MPLTAPPLNLPKTRKNTTMGLNKKAFSSWRYRINAAPTFHAPSSLLRVCCPLLTPFGVAWDLHTARPTTNRHKLTLALGTPSNSSVNATRYFDFGVNKGSIKAA